MKKHTLLIFLTTIIFAFTSCQDEIFNTIRDEIKLERSTIQGHINSIVRYTSGGTEYIFTQNGNVHYKKASDNYRIAWTRDSFWEGGISKIASDALNLYVLKTSWKEIVNDGEWARSKTEVFYKSSIDSTWTKIHTEEGNTVVNLFCTNSVKNDNRKAFLRIENKVYELSSSGIGTEMTLGTENAKTLPTSKTLSAVYFNGQTYFFDYAACITDETATSDATVMYYANSNKILYSTNGNTWNEGESAERKNGINVSSSRIESMSYTKDNLLLATGRGFKSAPFEVKDGVKVPMYGNDKLANTTSTLSSYYEIWAVLATDPSKNQADNSIYAGIDYSGTSSSTSAVFDNIGLWAYYSSRGKWNRE